VALGYYACDCSLYNSSLAVKEQISGSLNRNISLDISEVGILIRECSEDDCEAIFRVINEAAKAYRGLIPNDCYGDPYMPIHELRKEMSEMSFFGYKEEAKLLGAVGYQPIKDVTLVRHLYVLPEYQRRGIGRKLLNHIKSIASGQRLLVGTWEAATWAIGFYEKHGFTLQSNKTELLRKYWTIPERQIEHSVVLATDNP
jgi:GNAT superfamily N-acetyltransferase